MVHSTREAWPRRTFRLYLGHFCRQMTPPNVGDSCRSEWKIYKLKKEHLLKDKQML